MPERVCFVIAPIGDAGSEIRKRSDQILTYVINPPASDCGYHVVRADKIAEPGMITSQIIQHILDDPLVIADLTDRNPNVFYELALRHAIRKPFVQIIQEGQQIPFDVAGMRTVPVNHRDLDSVEQAKKDIAAQIRFIENEPKKLVTPISITLDLNSLRQSENPEQRSLADVLASLADLRSSLSALEKKLPSDIVAIRPNEGDYTNLRALASLLDQPTLTGWARNSLYGENASEPALGNLNRLATLTSVNPPATSGVPPGNSPAKKK